MKEEIALTKFILKYTGIVSIPMYITFTYVSHLYNRMINPIENWLSDYGNPLVNTHGAVFYNAGCVSTALMLAVFFIGMCRWYRHGRAKRKINICYAVAQAGGLIGSVFLILTTIYTLGTNTKLHATFSLAYIISFDLFLGFTATGFLMNPKINKGIPVFGFLICIFNVVTMNLFANFYLFEWICILMYMIYIVLLTLQYNLIIGERTIVLN